MHQCRTGHLAYRRTSGKALMVVEVKEVVLMATVAVVMAAAVGRGVMVVVA